MDPQRTTSRHDRFLTTPSVSFFFIVAACVLFAGFIWGSLARPLGADSNSITRWHGILKNSSANSPAGTTQSAANPSGKPYLMLVNTAIADRLTAPMIAQFDRSPYEGLAVSFAGAFDTGPAFTVTQMETQITGWKKSPAKEIWPWVYLNRMIGVDPAQGNAEANVPYFQRFQGLDLDGKAGAQADFLKNWQNALWLAKRTGAPGIVCDLEFYNNYKAYDLSQLALMSSISLPEVVKSLRQIGAHMADISAAEYPGADIWFLFTAFTRPNYRTINGQPYYLAATYLVEGLLDEIQLHHLPVRVLSGGEVGLGYCHISLADFQQAIDKRAQAFAPILQKYQGILQLAGTMTLWSDPAAKKSWVAQGACGASTAATVEDLIPYMDLLFRTYRYNWLYGSTNGGYYGFLPSSAPRFDAAIRKAEVLAYGSSVQ